MKEELFELKLQGYCCSQMVMEMGLRALGKQNEASCQSNIGAVRRC